MLHHGSKYSAHRSNPPPHLTGSNGQNSTFFRTWSCCTTNKRAWSIQHYASTYSLLTHTLNLWVGLKGKKKSECGHVSYQVAISASHVVFFLLKGIYILAWEFVMRSCLKPQNPCSNHEIHVLFEHGFYLKKSFLGPDLHA